MSGIDDKEEDDDENEAIGIGIVEYNTRWNRIKTKCCCKGGGCARSFKRNVSELKKSPRDLMVLYAITFLDSVSYFAFSYALIMHLGKEVGLPDESAGLFYGIFGVCISISTLLLGFVADWLQMKKSICLSSFLGLVSRMGMAYAVLARDPLITALVLFGAVGPSMALMGPAIPTAVKRYSTPNTRNFAFSVYYGVMNLAAFVATPAVDLIRLHITDDILLLPPYAMLIAVTALLQIPVFFAALFGIRDLKLTDEGEMVPIVFENDKVGGKIRGMLRNRNFWRASVIALALIGVKSTFRYFDALYLPYILRAFQDGATFPYLSLLAINPVIVISVTVTGLVTIVTNHFHPVTSMITGSFFGGIAPLFMTFGPYMYAILLYIIFTSVGEVIWSPVSYAYLIGMTGEGEEGAWMALAGLPMFAAKMLTGMLTGNLLSKFCPDPALLANAHNQTIATPSPPQLWGDPAQCYSAAIWGIIGATTISSFFLLIITYRFIWIPYNPGTEPVSIDNEMETFVEIDTNEDLFSEEEELDVDFDVANVSNNDDEQFEDISLMDVEK